MLLNFKESQKILSRYEIPMVDSLILENQEGLDAALNDLGFPVVMKIDSKETAHKTDIGGVKTGIENKEDAEKIFDDLFKIESGAVIVQKQTEGEEIIVGGKRDAVFGPVVMIGLGGILVEIYKDIVFKLAPLEKKGALEMIEEIKGKKILEGFRGRPVVNKESLAEVLVKTSSLLHEEPQIKELDFNPVLSGEASLVCDVKIII